MFNVPTLHYETEADYKKEKPLSAHSRYTVGVTSEQL